MKKKPTQPKGYAIQEPLGFTALPNSPFGPRVEIKLLTMAGQELSLVLDADGLRKLLICAIDGTAAFPTAKGVGSKFTPIAPLAANWHEGGRVPHSDDLYLSFFRESGSGLSFRFNQVLAERILESLAAMLGKASSTQPPKGTIN